MIVYDKHHSRFLRSQSGAPITAFQLIRPSIVTERASADQRLGSLGDPFFAKLSRVRNNRNEVRTT